MGSEPRLLRMGPAGPHRRTHTEDELLYVFADPSAHPFSIFVA
ncbi:MAG TPA: hypothetical protein VD814_05255 [Nocardioides sp.]|nr:hypothetical protein [Nocardioides sp.]